MIIYVNKRFKLDTSDYTFNQLLELVKQEEKYKTKKKLFDKASKITFTGKNTQIDDSQPYDLLDITLDPTLSEKEKDMK